MDSLAQLGRMVIYRLEGIALRRVPIFALVLLVWALLLYQLAVFPPVHEDEPWIASTSWQIASHGVFGSTLFAGLWGMEQRYYDFMPLYPMLSALVLRSASVGVFQARFVSAACGILVLALTFVVGRLLWSERVGYFASALLVVLPLTVPPYSLGSLFFDTSRLARYDILVPVLGLGAFVLFLRGITTRQYAAYAVAGSLTGLAGLTHLYGVFWFLSLCTLGISEKIGRRNLLLFTLGFFAPWCIYALYVVKGWEMFRMQTAWYGERFDLLNPSWYARNLAREIARYRFANFPAALVTSASLLSALVTVAWAARQKISSPRRLGIVLLCLALLLVLLEESKVPNYLIVIAPLYALALAFLLESLAQLLPGVRVQRAVCAALAISVLVLLFDTAFAVADNARTTTPYAVVATALRFEIPSGSRALVLHAYWFGLEDADARDWIVPLEWSMPHPGQATLSMFDALEQVAPDVIVIDPRMRAYLLDARTDARTMQIFAWMGARQFHCVKEFEDITYGRFDIYRRIAPSAANPPCKIP